MKPNFALSLYSEGLSLLQRFGSNWVLLDQVYLADADFDGRMEALRTAAMERSRSLSFQMIRSNTIPCHVLKTPDLMILKK